MANVQVRGGEDEWRDVRGTALKIPGVGLYRLVLTDALYVFDGVRIEDLEIRVNGLLMRNLAWVLPPSETIGRGYVSIEATMA